MLVSTRGRYALRVMIDIAENSNGNYIPLKEIAKRQQISEKYLENILPTLIKNKVLIGVRGKGGGYKLMHSPDSYTVGSILKLIEGNLAPVACLGENEIECPKATECKTLPMWQGLQQLIENYLNDITIADLCANEKNGYDFVI